MMSTSALSVPTLGMIGRLREIWRYRELLRSLIVRNLKVKYERSLLGFVWTLLNPLLTVGVLIAVFSYVVRIPIADYWAFLLSGYFVWNFILQTLNSGTYVLSEHGQLSRSVAFPKEVPVLAAALSRLVEFTAELALVLVLLSVFLHEGLPVGFAFVPWLVLLQFLVSLGLVFPIATLSVFYHDVQHALPILLTTLFYVSPVFYPASMIPEAVRPFYMANPIAGIMTLYHVAVYDGRVPSIELLGTMTLIALLLAWIGYAIFNRYETVFAEVV